MSALAKIAGAKIVVTGGCGLIGRPTVEHMARLGASVTVFARPGAPSDWVAADVAESVEFVFGDVTDLAAVRSVLAGKNAVIHLGGYAGLGMASASETYRVNVTGTFNVLSEAASAGLDKAVYASSINANGYPLGSLHSSPPVMPYNEYAKPIISDEYSLSKQASEDAAVMIANTTSLSITGLRYPLTRDISIDGGRFFGKDVLQRMIDDPRRQAAEGWSYLDLNDAARAAELALLAETPAAPGILVAAPDTYLLNPTLTVLARDLPTVEVGAFDETRFDGRGVGLDLTLAKDWLGFEAKVLFKDIAPNQLVDIDKLEAK